MTVQLNNDGTLAITAMSLVEFLPEIEEAIHQGFMLDLTQNQGVPQQFGTLLIVTMFPAGEVLVQDVDNDESFVITPETNLSEVTQPAGEEAEKALQEAVQETAVSTSSEQPVKLDGRRKKS